MNSSFLIKSGIFDLFCHFGYFLAVLGTLGIDLRQATQLGRLILIPNKKNPDPVPQHHETGKNKIECTPILKLAMLKDYR